MLSDPKLFSEDGDERDQTMNSVKKIKDTRPPWEEFTQNKFEEDIIFWLQSEIKKENSELEVVLYFSCCYCSYRIIAPSLLYQKFLKLQTNIRV